MLRGYLAGGMRSGWQDQVMAALPEIAWLDPRSHGLTDEAEYTNWDVLAVMRAEIIFAYMEAENPGGHGLALEIGLAAGLNIRRLEGEPQHHTHKTIVLIDPTHHRYLGMARQLSAFVAPTLEAGIAYIRTLITPQEGDPDGTAAE
jgi:hypothetical protein